MNSKGQNQNKMARQASQKTKNVKGKSVPKQASVASAYATGQLGRAPRMQQMKDSIRVQHRELVTSVTGSSAFTVASALALNPGLSVTFPWLSTLANSWEEYSFNSLRFEYFTRTGSSTPGSVIMTPDYDASDAAPVSEQQACAYEDVVEDAPWKDICCVLPGSRLNAADKFRFVRSGALGANQDIKLYDAGNLFACTIDGTAVNWGKLWVEYDVTFRIPQLNPGSSAASLLGGSAAAGGVQSAANPFGDAPVPNPSNLGFTLDNASVVSFTQLGTFLVSVSLTSGLAMTAHTMTAGAGVTVTSTNELGNGTALYVGFFSVVVTSLVAATMAFTCAGGPPTSGFVDVASAPAASLL